MLPNTTTVHMAHKHSQRTTWVEADGEETGEHEPLAH